ncbi:MAG: hypothetical protein Tsb009_39330 [Planctomycetaceae bacterium]
MNDTPTIQYLNTDLDLVCDVDPTLLVDEMDSQGLYADVNRGEDGLFYVICEDDNDTEPEPNIRQLLDAVDALSEDARKLWTRCSKREFNVGYDCGDEPWSFNQGLSNEVLRRIADCGASFRITLYPYRPGKTVISHVGDDG